MLSTNTFLQPSFYSSMSGDSNANTQAFLQLVPQTGFALRFLHYVADLQETEYHSTFPHVLSGFLASYLGSSEGGGCPKTSCQGTVSAISWDSSWLSQARFLLVATGIALWYGFVSPRSSMSGVQTPLRLLSEVWAITIWEDTTKIY